MATITITEKMYEQLAQQASSRNLSVEELLEPILDEIAQRRVDDPSLATMSFEEWKTRYDEWQAMVKQRKGEYPAGFRVDVSRDSIYEALINEPRP